MKAPQQKTEQMKSKVATLRAKARRDEYSARDEPTLSSVRRILADPSCAQPPTTLNATLLGLPSLFLSLAARKGSAAAKYLATAMESFGAENLVKAHATAAVPSPSTAAFA